MRHAAFALVIALLVLASPSVLAQSGSGSLNIQPKGIAGSAGAGVVLFDVRRPSSDFVMDQGLFAAVSGERGFGFLNLYLTLSLAYLRTEGQTAYDYETLSGDAYTGTDVPFTTNLFQSGLGLKFKLLSKAWFRPYVEGGGLAGYYQMQYGDMGRVDGPGNDAKDTDALLDFGAYAEAGLEISFSKDFGLRFAARLTENKTKPFATLGDQRIEYRSEVYYLNLLRQF